MELTNIKSSILFIAGLVGGALAKLLGGWDMAIQTLLTFMVIDYVMGLILAGVFHKSKKTETGSLSSSAGLKGIFKKVVVLLVVVVGTRVDIMMGTDTVRYGVIIAFCINEVTSIIENAGLMGIKLPAILVQALDVLQKTKQNK